VGEDLKEFLGKDFMYKIHFSRKNLHVLWNGGETLVHAHHQAMPTFLHDNMNSVFSEFYFANAELL